MEMEPTTMTPFRFRDHDGINNSILSDSSSDISSLSDAHFDDEDRDDDSDVRSMTAKGIKHLCSELLELKAASDEDFQGNVVSNYSAFLRIFEEVGGIENELVQLKNHVSKQKVLINDLVHGVYSKIVMEEIMESEEEEFDSLDNSSPLSILEPHIHQICESLDILLAEGRTSEICDIIEVEDGKIQKLQEEMDSPCCLLSMYSLAISKRKEMLKLQLISVAENPRTCSPELQRALVAICRLGDNNLALQLLLKYYHSRLASAMHRLQSSKFLPNGLYIRELAKFVFSLISQAARSFVMLFGETSPYASELIEWACEETRTFAACFNMYVISISEISGRLSTAVLSLQFAMSFCSLLETQKLTLGPCLIEEIQPCMEEVLRVHVDYFKKVVVIFTATDTCTMGKYLVWGILAEEVVIGRQPEYCFLSNSGRKLMTLLQAIAEDISPLLSLQIGNTVIRKLTDLLIEYIALLEKVITGQSNFLENGHLDSRDNRIEMLTKQVSILLNVANLECLFPRFLKSIFNDTPYDNEELECCLSLLQQSSFQIRSCFHEQYISALVSNQSDCGVLSNVFTDDLIDSTISDNLRPSVAFQVLFLDLRSVEKLTGEEAYEAYRLKLLLRDLIEAVYVFILKSKGSFTFSRDNVFEEDPNTSQQFILDMQFLYEIAKHGDYFSENPFILLDLMKSAYMSAGLDPQRDVTNAKWAETVAREAIQKLQEIDNNEVPIQEPDYSIEVDSEFHEAESGSIEEESSSIPEDIIETEENEEARSASFGVGRNMPKTEADLVQDQIDHHDDHEFSEKSSSSIHELSNPESNKSAGWYISLGADEGPHKIMKTVEMETTGQHDCVEVVPRDKADT